MENGITMKTNQPDKIEESTYALLVRSEERKRGLFETIIYGLTILSPIAAIWQFTSQVDPLPLGGLPSALPA
jgi:hypothetical protein